MTVRKYKTGNSAVKEVRDETGIQRMIVINGPTIILGDKKSGALYLRDREHGGKRYAMGIARGMSWEFYHE